MVLMLSIFSIFQMRTRSTIPLVDCQKENPINPQSRDDQETQPLPVHDASNETKLATQTKLQSPRAKAFSNLEIFVSTFPGKMTPFQEDENVYGFEELKETLIRR